MSQVIVRVENESLDPDSLRKLINLEGSGSIVSFIGVTRESEGDASVDWLEFDSWAEKLPSVLENLAFQSIYNFSVNSVVIAHRVGTVLPKEPIVCIHVSSTHRAEGFEACSWLISELKKQAPLWKKEVRSDGEFWKSGLG